MNRLLTGFAAAFVAVALVGVAKADGPFRLTAGDAVTTYSSLSDAVTALNAVDSATACKLELTADATFSESVGIMHDKVTLGSTGATPYTLTRTDANACIFFGMMPDETTLLPSGAIIWTMNVTNLTIDGGAKWTSDDISVLTQEEGGIGAGKCILSTLSRAWNNYTALNFQNGATVQNVQTGDGSYKSAVYCNGVSGTALHKYGGGRGRFNLLPGSKITQCRGASAAVRCLPSAEDVVYVNGGEISYCSSTDNGGAICSEGNGYTVRMSAGSIHHCRAKNGGAIYLKASYLKMSGGEIYSNTATDQGGGVFAGAGWSSSAGMYTGGAIRDNVAGKTGGGVWLNSNGKKFSMGGAMRIFGNIGSNATTPMTDNLRIDTTMTDSTKFELSSMSDDFADVGLTLANGLVNVGDTFATCASGLTAADFTHLHFDSGSAVHPVVDGTSVKWAAGAATSVAAVTVGSETTEHISFLNALEQANAEDAATVTLHAGVTISSDYVVSGDVTLATDAAGGVTVSRTGTAVLTVAGSGKLTLTGAGVTIGAPVSVASGATLAVATGATPAFGGAITLPAGSTLALAGAPTFAFPFALPNATTLTLAGPLTGDVTVAYPANGETYKGVAFGKVASGYTPTASDLSHFAYAYAAATAEVNGDDLRWSSGDVKVVRVGDTEYASLGEAIDAACLLDNPTVEILKDLTISSRLCVTASMTIASADGVTAKITRISSDAGFDVGKDATGATVLTKDVTLTFRDIILDGGAIWTSSDVTDLSNTGIAAGQPLMTAVSTGVDSSLDPTLCGKIVLASGAEIRNHAGQVAYLDYHTRLDIASGVKVQGCRASAADLFFCRTTSFSFAGEVTRCAAVNTAAGGTAALFHFDKAGSNYHSGSDAAMTDGRITDSYFTTGCFWPAGAKLTISGGEISSNSGREGAAIYRQWQGTHKLVISGGVITNNTVSSGAAVYISTLKNDMNKGDFSKILYLSGDVVIKDNWVKNPSSGTITRRNIFSTREHEYLADWAWYNVAIGGPLTGEVQITYPDDKTALADLLGVPFGAVVSSVYSPRQSDARHLVYEGNPVEGKQVNGYVDRATGKLTWALNYPKGLLLIFR